MSKSKKTVRKASELVVDLSLNDRDPTNVEVTWDLATMRRQIEQFRRITDPIHYEMRVVPGREADGVLPVVLKGNRRTLAAQWWMSQKDCPADLLQNLSRIDCVEWSDLEDMEREEMIADKGSALPLAKYEIALAIWRMMAKATDFKVSETKDRIRLTCHQLLAQFTGNEAGLRVKLDKLDRSQSGYEAAKLEVLRSHFHGTLDNILLGVWGFGEYCRAQYILTLKEEQGKLLPSDPKPEVRLTTKRITELSKTRTKDQKEKGWLAASGGEHFNALLKKFRDEDSGAVPKAKSSRPTVEELMTSAGNTQHPALAKGLKLAAGITGDQVAGYESEADEAYRQWKCLELLGKAHAGLPKELQPLSKALLSLSPMKFQEFLRDTCGVNVDL